MPITINDVRREVLVGLSRIRIHDSDTIEVADGDNPMKPSIKAGATGLTAGDGINITPIGGVVSIADFDILPDLAGGDTSSMFVALWNTQIQGLESPGMMSVLDLLAQPVAVPDPITISLPDQITFRDVGTGVDGTTTLSDLFNTIAVPRESHIDLFSLAAEHAFS